MTTTGRGPWLFTRGVDLAAFGGSALIALLLVVVAWAGGDVAWGAVDAPAPEWIWIATIVGVDVAHVWGTALLVYLDPVEVRRRPLLYAVVPAAGLAIGWAIASESELWFWRALAYVAAFHFVRQQVGWVKLYRARAGDADPIGRFVDEGAAYAATLGPLVWWHSRLPTSIAWLAPGDFAAGLPVVVGDAALVVQAAFLAAYAARALTTGRGQPGKHLVVFTTALLWNLGIVAWANDVVFTLTNVIAHGVPYVVLVVWTGRRRIARGLSASRVVRAGALAVVGALWTFAVVEELLWDRLIHHERGGLFPLPAVDVDEWRPLVIAALALPQLVHYVLDAFYWRRRDNPTL